MSSDVKIKYCHGVRKTSLLLAFLSIAVLHGCVPKENVVLRQVNIHDVDQVKDGMALLKADAVFFNPNSSRMKLKKIDIDVLVDGKNAARIDQKLDALIKANSEFTVPLEIQLNLKEVGLVETLLSLLGGKKHEIQFTGSIKLKVNGFPFHAPVSSRQEFRF